MEHLTTTPDVRDLDCLHLATIGGVDYFETRQIVKMDNGVRSVVGLASAWPLIQRDARIGELTALLVASERRSVEADCHVSELIARLSAYEELFAVTPAAAPLSTETPLQNQERMFAEQAAINAGAAACDHCDWRGHPKGLAPHKKRAHGVAGRIGHKPISADDPNTRRKCPHCDERPKAVGLDAHIKRKHPEHTTAAAAPPIAIALGEAPWRCASCGTDTFARSVADPTICKKCLIARTDGALSNGHLAAA
jgi:hypothetical protein